MPREIRGKSILIGLVLGLLTLVAWEVGLVVKAHAHRNGPPPHGHVHVVR